MFDLSSLNKEQKDAVLSFGSPLLIIAGAGSGKTRVLTYKIAYIIQQQLASPDNILAVTFTNKAAAEMKSRINELLASKANVPWAGTFHSICLRILKSNAQHLGYSNQITIYDTSDQQQLVKDVLKSLNFDTKKVNPNAVLAMISNAKSELITPSEYSKSAIGYFPEITAKVYPEYQKLLQENNAMDFDDLIMQTVLLFRSAPAVLAKYQELFKYILIDEYQDTNHAQYMFAKLLAQKHRNICVVGDDAQSIYSFRGATIRNILNFEKDYPEAKIIKLEQNYRSTKTILEASNKVISLNSNQKTKNLWTENSEGESIQVYEAMDEKDEAMWIAEQIFNAIKSGVNPEEIAILYRTNAQSRVIEEYMIRAGISYRIVGNVRFYDRKEIKDILAYLRLLVNPDDNISTKRIINVPRRGIGPKSIKDLEFAAAARQKSMLGFLFDLDEQEQYGLSKGIVSFKEALQILTDASKEQQPYELIKTVLEITSYLDTLQDGSTENDSRIENIKELMALAKQFTNPDPTQALSELLDQIALIEQSANANDSNEEKITLMSIHAAKGLEFEHVYVCGVEEGIFPHSRSYTDPTEMEEERRLAYVAITRAKKKLHLTYAQSRVYFGSRTENLISRFITDIPENLLVLSDYTGSLKGMQTGGWNDASDFVEEKPFVQLSSGDKVKHPVFGVGFVEELDDSIIIVRFAKGKKELALEYANLTKLSN